MDEMQKRNVNNEEFLGTSVYITGAAATCCFTAIHIFSSVSLAVSKVLTSD